MGANCLSSDPVRIVQAMQPCRSSVPLDSVHTNAVLWKSRRHAVTYLGFYLPSTGLVTVDQ